MLFKHALAVGLAIIAMSVLMIMSASLTLSDSFSASPNSYPEQGQEHPSNLGANVQSYQTVPSNMVLPGASESTPLPHNPIPSSALPPPQAAEAPSTRTPQSFPSPPLTPTASTSSSSPPPPQSEVPLSYCQRLESEYGISGNDWGRLPIMMQAEYKQHSCTGGMKTNNDMEPPQIAFTQVRPRCHCQSSRGM